MYKHIARLTNTHEQSLIPQVHCTVNTMRSVPVMREPRAVLITCGGSEDLCQSLRAHFIQPENLTKSPLIYHFTSFSLTPPASQLVLLIHCRGSPSFCSHFSSPIFCCLICLAFSFSPLPCISLLIYVNPFAVRMKLV